jgi:lipoate-protein ligase B
MAICHVVRIPRISYSAAFDLQLRIVAAVKATRPADAVLLLLEHDPVITIGRSGSGANVLAAPDVLAERGVELHETTRGGDVTYHGPGQIVGYPILRLARPRQDVHRYMRSLETVLIRSLARFGIEAHREAGLTGVWTDRGKIAAMGVAFTQWVAYHGFALNVSTRLRDFELIVPCGITGRAVTSMEALLGEAPPRERVEDALIEEFVAEFAFDRAEEHTTPDDLPPDLLGG